MPTTGQACKALLVLVAVATLPGCVRRFDPRAETVRASPDAVADREYHEAKTLLDNGDARGAERRFADFLQHHPNDALAPSARIGQARAQLLLDQPKKAEELLAPVAAPGDDPTAARGRFLLGMALHKTGDWSRSRELLRPFGSEMANGEDAVELHAVLGDDAAHLNDLDEALAEYDRFYAGARPAERLYLRDRVGQLVAALPAAEAARLYGAHARDGLSLVYLGRRVAADRRTAGDEEGAHEALERVRGAERAAGMEEPPAEGVKLVGGGRSIGLVLPLSGRQRALGERALRGALLANDLMLPEAESHLAPVELKVRDSGSDPNRAGLAVEELAKEGVGVLVSSPERAEAQAAVGHAETLGVPVLALAPDDTRRAETTFKMVRPPRARARELAEVALARGARSVALLLPDTAYGRSMAAAFTEEATKKGMRILAEVRFAEAATTFIEPVRRIARELPDALFVPASAAQLALIAPQLAASGVTALPGMKATRTARLYATADGLSEKVAQSTVKYLEGAVLGPLFYPDVGEPRMEAFVDRYRQAFGEEPTGLDALAFDAVHLARLAIERSGGLRTGMAAALPHASEGGVTGELGFGAGGERSGTAPLYVVERGAVHVLK